MSSLKVKPLEWREDDNDDVGLFLKAETIGGNAAIVRSICRRIGGDQTVTISFGMPAIGEIGGVGGYADSIEQAQAECEKIHAERVLQVASKFLTIEDNDIDVLVRHVLSNVVAGLAKVNDAPISAQAHFDSAINELAKATNWRPADAELVAIIDEAIEHMAFYGK